MKLLLDQGLPTSAAALLRALGYDALHTSEVELSFATDDEVLNHARREGRCVVTLDADFHTLLALSGATAPSVIRIRIEGLKAKACAELIHSVLIAAQPYVLAGAALSVESKGVRIRRLPFHTP